MTKIEELFAYLDRLIALQSAGHAVRKEIAEVIAAIRRENRSLFSGEETMEVIEVSPTEVATIDVDMTRRLYPGPARIYVETAEKETM